MAQREKRANRRNDRRIFAGLPNRFLTLMILLLGFSGLLLYLWPDFCLWAADRSLAHQNTSAATRWVDRGKWLLSQPNAKFCLARARIARKQGDFQTVELQLQNALRLGAKRSEVQRENLIAMAQTNQFQAVESNWNDLLQDLRDDEPEIARAYYTWAMLNHHLDLALKTLQSWINDMPQDPEPLLLLGRYHQQGPDWEEVEKAFRKCLKLTPRNDEAQIGLANALHARLKSDEAIPLYEEYLKKHPEDVSAIQGLAQCLTSIGKADDGIVLLRKSLATRPEDPVLNKVYGELLFSTGALDEATSALEQAYRQTPENANLANVLARAYKACGRKDDAESLMAFVAESRPEVEQLTVIEKALKADPKNIALRMKVAAITAKYVSRQDGIRWYQNILRLSPQYLPAHRELAVLYRQIGDDDRAASHDAVLKQGSR